MITGDPIDYILPLISLMKSFGYE